MPHIAVIGAGLGGLATAARLAKLGHSVTLVESAPTVGGAITPITHEGFVWDGGPTYTLLPAVLRDLFRKTGRPLEQELDLIPSPATLHMFADGSSVTVPGGSRAAQLEALNLLGPGLGDMWINYVAEYAETWELLRRDFLERPYQRALASPELRRLLDSRESLGARVAAAIRDPRLRAVAEFPHRLEGHRPDQSAAWVGVEAYLTQRFGEWTVRDGFSALTQALERRLTTRGVTVLTEVTVRDLVMRGGVVRAILTDQGELQADLVVCAIDPTRLPQLRKHLRRTHSTVPPDVCHLAVEGTLSWQTPTVIHGEGLLVVRPGPAVGDTQTVTVLTRGLGDPVLAMAQHGVDLGTRVLVRIDRDATSQQAQGSAYGVEWRGRGTVRRRLGPTTPLSGVYAAGAHANPGAGVAMVGLSAALVAQAIGPAR